MVQEIKNIREFLKGSGRGAYRYAAEISFPRLVGSSGETEAREKIKNTMRDLGLEVTSQKLRASDYSINRLARFALLLPGLLLLSASIANYYNILSLSIIFALATLAIIFWAGSRSNRGFVELQGKGNFFSAENIIGTLPCQGKKARVIFMAHYDSKSQTFPVILRIVLLLLGALGTMALAMAITGSSLAQFAGLEITFSGLLLWASIFIFIIDFLPAFNYVHNRSDGALDNAAGVGVMLELARLFKADPPEGLELMFVATAAEELGLCGAGAFIREWADKLDPQTTRFINFDSPGSRPRVTALSAFGIPKRMLDMEMNRWIREIGKEHAVPLSMLYLPVGAAVDLVAVMSKGFSGVNLSSMVKNVHTPLDTIDKVNESGLEHSVIIGYALVQRLVEKYA